MKKLPKSVTLEVDRDLNLDTEGADVLSDKYGFCVFSFEFEIVSKTKKTKTVKFSKIQWDTSE